jgi:hypothetical protein
MVTSATELLRLPTRAETDIFFAEQCNALAAADRLEVRADADGSGGRGKGIFVKAGSTVEAGEVLFTESPAVSVQAFASRKESFCCARCSRFVDSVPAQIKHWLAGLGYGISKLDLHAGALGGCVELPEHVQCQGQCNTMYVFCSTRRPTHLFLLRGRMMDEMSMRICTSDGCRGCRMHHCTLHPPHLSPKQVG